MHHTQVGGITIFLKLACYIRITAIIKKYIKENKKYNYTPVQKGMLG